jgi:hypothetical protein
MNPRKMLEGFRVDPTESKKLPNSNRNMYKKGNAFVIILFATILGLMTGISSAFAYGIKELPPISTPLDEPKAEYKVNHQQEKPVQPAEKQISELPPLQPPIDEPTIKQSKQKKEEEQVKQVKQAKSHEQVEKTDQPKKKEQPKVSKETEQKKHKEQSKHQEQKKEQPKVSEHSPKPKINPQPEQKEHKTSKGSEVVLSQSKPAAVTPPIASVKLEKPSKKVSAAEESPAQATETQPEQDKATTSETPTPTTKPGKLPDTAGDDLNHALASFIIVCFSIAYLLAKKETRPE